MVSLCHYPNSPTQQRPGRPAPRAPLHLATSKMPPLRRRDGAFAAAGAVATGAAFWAWYLSESGPVQVPRLVGGGTDLGNAVRAR